MRWRAGPTARPRAAGSAEVGSQLAHGHVHEPTYKLMIECTRTQLAGCATRGLDEVSDGYRAMADREALEVLVDP